MPQSSCFAFDVPDGWRHERDGTRAMYLDGSGGVLIVSAAAVSPPGADVARRVRDIALDAVRRTESDPELVTVQPLAQRPAAEGLELWTKSCRSADGRVLFSQAVVAGDEGAMLLTWESPAGGRHVEVFETFLNSIRRVRPSPRPAPGVPGEGEM
jgi:hypothetical protein